MPKPTNAAIAVLGLAACGAVIWFVATAHGGSAPPPNTSANTHTTAPIRPPTSYVPPPLPSHVPRTGQFTVVPQTGTIPVPQVNRSPVTVAPPPGFAPHHAATGHEDYRKKFRARLGYPPPRGTSPRQFYLECMSRARTHHNSHADLTCQYLATQVG